MFRDFKKYEIFPDGRVWSYVRNKWLKPQLRSDGYFQIPLRDNDGKRKNYLHHRVVYEACSQAPIPDGLDVNHINEIKTDNRFENLNLMTRKENNNHGTHNERVSKSLTNYPSKSKQVVQYDKEENLINIYPSLMEVHRQFGYNYGHISQCCNGKRKSAHGFIWKFAS